MTKHIMDQINKKYTEEEAKAALTLLCLAGSLDLKDEETWTTNLPSTGYTGIESPVPSDTTDDLIIDESELLQTKEEEDETLTPDVEETTQDNPPEAEDAEECNDELTTFLAENDLESMIGRMTRVALSSIDLNSSAEGNGRGTFGENNLRQKLERFINEAEVQGTKYHASMKRVYASAVDRPLDKQINRDKNNTASRLSRIRLRNAEQNLKIEAQKLDQANMAKRMKKAILLNYLQMLHHKLRLGKMDFNRPVKEILRDYGVDWERVKGGLTE